MTEGATRSTGMKLFDLTGKRALVTGSAGGIGLTLARGLREAGAEVILNGRSAERLDQAAANLGAAALPPHKLVFDVTEGAEVRAAIDGFEADVGGIDILVNNAGVQHRTPLEDFEAADFNRLVSTNLSSAFFVGQSVARHMLGRGAGKIINIGSAQTALARPGIAPYTATKGAIGNLTKGMAADWAGYGLQCNALAPGYFATPLNTALVDDPDFSAWLANRTPAGRWGQVEELIGACVFLSSPASSFVNGHTLFVDGGITTSL